MKKEQRAHRKSWLAAGIVLLALVVCAGGFFWYVSDYYPAEDVALEVMAQDNGITVQDRLTVLSLLPCRYCHSFLSRSQGGSGGLSAAAGSDPPDRSYLHFSAHALSHGDF